jgi:archaellin
MPFQYNTYGGGTFSIIDMDVKIRNWRTISIYPEVEEALKEIITEMIIPDTEDNIVSIDLSRVKGDSKKKAVQESFDKIMTLLRFNDDAENMVRNWYVDGRIVFEAVRHKNDTKKGILELNPMDPLNLKQYVDHDNPNKTIYYVYSPKFGDNRNPLQGFQPEKPIDKDLIIFVGSGFFDRSQNIELSYLEKAVKAANNLMNIEDGVIIYRLSRASEKRIFKIFTGGMNKTKAEEFIRKQMQQFSSGLNYNQVTGEISTSHHKMAIIEDFWLPYTQAGQGPTVDILQSGQNLGQIDDLYYFQMKLYVALGIPINRISKEGSSSVFNYGRSTEIERTEIKFTRMIEGFRKKFSILFTDLIKKDLIWKNEIKETEWEKDYRPYIKYQFNVNNLYKEIKESEMLASKIDLAERMENLVNKYFTRDDVALQALRFTEDEWEKKKKQIKKDLAENPPPEDIEDDGQFNNAGEFEYGELTKRPPQKPKPPKED